MKRIIACAALAVVLLVGRASAQAPEPPNHPAQACQQMLGEMVSGLLASRTYALAAQRELASLAEQLSHAKSRVAELEAAAAKPAPPAPPPASP